MNNNNNNFSSIQLAGGLGNNLFQIASIYAYAKKYNKELVLHDNKIGIVHKSFDTYKKNILSKINFSNKTFSKNITYQEKEYKYNEIPEISGNVILDGYFHSHLYFHDINNEIIDLFSDENTIKKIKEKYNDLLENKITCSIHVRRGDYLNLQNLHPTQNMNYYLKAVKLMPKETVFLIFSDDIFWCKESFPDIPEKFIFIQNEYDYEDLYLMSLCTNNIIANSSFSWWSAYLNKNEDKIVIAPSKWFGPDLMHNDTSTLYCDNWIKI